MTYPRLEKVKSIITYPFRLALLPLIVFLGFVLTNFNDEFDVMFYKKTIRYFLKPYGI